ncbi:hypothetical protein GA0115246_1139811 [Streptomyces sp. SolWspMP-sol7th]|nr:hypothetical protein GA0115246_1139811 [Streptomyces sp. SolWspMP-sol7th]
MALLEPLLSRTLGCPNGGPLFGSRLRGIQPKGSSSAVGFT